MNNLLALPPAATAENDEFFQTLLRGRGGLRVERIISHGHTTPEGEWYDQDQDEWVAVIKGEARVAFADGDEMRLSAGDTLFLPAQCRHRVAYTSSPCVWLAVFGDTLLPDVQP